MQMDRMMGMGVTARQVRQVAAAVEGMTALAHRLGVSHPTAQRWLQELGLQYRPAPRRTGQANRRISDAQVRDAVLSDLSLHQAAFALGVSGAALHMRARRIGLPTDRAGREALRSGRIAA